MALKFEHAPIEQIEKDFGVDDLVEKINRIQIAEFLGWTFDVIDRLTWQERLEIVGYLNAKGKASTKQWKK